MFRVTYQFSARLRPSRKRCCFGHVRVEKKADGPLGERLRTIDSRSSFCGAERLLRKQYQIRYTFGCTAVMPAGRGHAQVSPATVSNTIVMTWHRDADINEESLNANLGVLGNVSIWHTPNTINAVPRRRTQIDLTLLPCSYEMR